MTDLRREWTGVHYTTKALLAMGRTCPHIGTLATNAEIDQLREMYGVLKDTDLAWPNLSGVQRIDVIASQILHDEKQRRLAEAKAMNPQVNRDERFEYDEQRDRAASHRHGDYPYLSRWQYHWRSSHEVPFSFIDASLSGIKWIELLHVVKRGSWLARSNMKPGRLYA
jgi:hypothetical protein